MKPMYEISTRQEIDHQRAVLLKQLYKQEKQVNRDINHISDSWKRWTNVGSIVSNVAALLLPKINFMSIGWDLLGKIFKRKKK